MWKEMLRRVTGGGASIAPPVVGAYGKLPRIGDFVAVHAEKAPAFGFQDWLGRAVDWADRKQLAGWPVDFDSRPGASFTYRPAPSKRNDGVLVGALWPSRDAVGRRYPFTIFSTVSEDLAKAAPHLLPIAMDAFVDHAYGLKTVLGNVTSASEVDSILHAIRPLEVDESVGRTYESWLASTSARQTWEHFYRRPDGDGTIWAIQMIRATLAPFVGVEHAPTDIAVRLPLGRNPAFETAFWLDVIHRIGGAPRAVPTTFHYPPPGVEGRGLYVALGGDPHPSTLAEATIGVGDTDQVCDLTVSEPDRGSMARLAVLAGGLEGAIRNENATLAHVIDALA